MKLRDFRIGWRTLIQEPAYSLVVVLGLGIGLAACMLLLGFVRYSWQYDAHVPDGDNVYVLKQRYTVDPQAPWFERSPYILRNMIMNTPGVVAVTGYHTPFPESTVRVGNHLHKLNIVTVLPGFTQMLGLKSIEGDFDAALNQPENFAITEESAMKTFGTSHALGRTMQIDGKLLRVAAILQNPPTNTTIHFSALNGMNSIIVPDEMRNGTLNGPKIWLGKFILRIQPGSALNTITESLQHAVDQSSALQELPPDVMERLGKRRVIEIKLSPLRDAYFDRDIANNPMTGPGERGDPTTVGGLAVVAILILMLATINYVNLATVRILRRQREIGMRKVLGASTRQIALQFLAESLLVAMLATALGLLLAWLALPVFSELMNRKLEGLFSPANVGAAMMLGVLLGVVSGIYPAWIAIRIRPATVLAGRHDTESQRGRRLRQAMTVLQISTAMSLGSIALAIAWQTDFAIHASPGFDPAPLLIVDLPESVKNSEKARGFIEALSRQPGVLGTAISIDAVGRSYFKWIEQAKREDGSRMSLEIKEGSANFFEQYQIRPLAGRLFDSHIDKDDDKQPIVLNAVAARELGFTSPESAVGKNLVFVYNDGTLVNRRIVGVAPELRFRSMRETQRAIAYTLSTDMATLSVRTTGEISDVEHAVDSLWPTYFPESLVAMRRAADIFSAHYNDDARLVKLLEISTAIALAIAAFGTYVLSAHSVQRRAKEIVLRKLYGARRRDIAALVVKEVGVLIGISAIIGLPIAALTIARYLAGFVEHAPIGYWTLLSALASTLLIALIAVARHAWIAMNMMPSAALRE